MGVDVLFAHSGVTWTSARCSSPHFAVTPPWLQVVGGMVSEIILCVKEVNQKTRTAAYELLVSLAQAMHQQHPPPPPAMSKLGQDVDMDVPTGGLPLCWPLWSLEGTLLCTTPTSFGYSLWVLCKSLSL